MSSQLERLLSGLYLALNRDPDPQPGILVNLLPLGGAIPSSYWIRIEDDHLRGTPQVAQAPQGPEDPGGSYLPLHQSLDLDLYQIGTLGNLVAYLNTLPGFSAALTPETPATRLASSLVEGVFDLVTDPHLDTYGSLLWALLKPVAWAMQSQREDALETLPTTTPGRAQGLWLNTIGDLYGIDRVVGETDDQYRTRVLFEVIKPRCNNVAMAEYLKWALALADVSITDDPTIAFRFLINLTMTPGGGLPVPIPRIRTIVNEIKAWGVIWIVNLTGIDSESFIVQDIVTEAVSYIFRPPAESHPMIAATEAPSVALTQRYNESARGREHYLTTNVWKTGHTTVVSATNNPDVILESWLLSYRSWVRHITDVWTTNETGATDTDSWSTITNAIMSATYRFLYTADATRLRLGARDVVTTSLARTTVEPARPRRRQLVTNRNACRSNSRDSWLSASATGSFLSSIGDTSWIRISHVPVTRGSGATIVLDDIVLHD